MDWGKKPHNLTKILLYRNATVGYFGNQDSEL
jgi:hypothetical protein